tara:strand:+ start:1570 stop:1902 length:333 start_codon:yes stop_codon:yes gene_type:complete
MATPAPLRDGKAAAAKRKRERKSAHRDKAYTAWIHQFGCFICGKEAEQHHWPYRSHTDWHDKFSLMLCSEHHRGGTGFHLLTKEGFEKLHKVNVAAEIERLNKLYEGVKK